MHYSHFIVGLLPKDKNPEDNPLTYDTWLFKDVKTWNGAHRRAQGYAKMHNNARKDMTTVLMAYTCSPTDGHTPPVRWSRID